MLSPDRGLRVAVVGATGVVGQEFFRVLKQRKFPVAKLKALASERSAGSEIEWNGGTVPVEALTERSFDGVDVALFSAGSGISRTYAPAAQRAGALVVDNSSAWRMEPGVPLVVPEVNPDDLKTGAGIVANPNCCAIPLTVVLEPLRRAAGLARVVVATYQSASGAGKGLVEELDEQTKAIAERRVPEAREYPHQLAMNVVPGGWPLEDDGYYEEEVKIVHEARKILHEPELRVVATCVRVPVPVGHAEAVFVETERDLGPEEAREVLRAAPGIVVQDDPASQGYPTPAAVAGTDEVYVGRIRRDASARRGLALWVVADNLRKGAALNAVQVAERALEMGLLERGVARHA
ncbi:MAG TPA: aspartate-semialdehyde dehydrogenase [Candidatus Dormibacteraeota bacterium]|nr:aspartate-semialdehyde dehydrogenase [Candidatus Dormibacteraeota bacterium]